MRLNKFIILSFVALITCNAHAAVSGFIGNRATAASSWGIGWGVGYTYAKGKILLSSSGDSRYVLLAGHPIDQNPKSFTLVRDEVADYDIAYSIQTQNLQGTVAISILDMNCDYTCEFTFSRNSYAPVLTKGDPLYCTSENLNLYILKSCNNVITATKQLG